LIHDKHDYSEQFPPTVVLSTIIFNSKIMKPLKNQILILPLFLLIPLISCGQTIDGKKERLNFKIQNEVVFYKGSPFSGKVVCYYENDKLQSESSFKDGKPDGKSVQYYNDGIIKAIEKNESDKNNRIREDYYKNGQLSFREIIINGKYEGLKEEFYGDGKIKLVGSFINDLKEGEWKSYYSNGKISLLKTYKNGEVIKKVSYDKVSGNVEDNFLSEGDDFFGVYKDPEDYPSYKPASIVAFSCIR